MTEQEIERCLERLSTCKAADIMNFDYAGTLAYIQRLKAENAALCERLSRAVELPCRVGDTIYSLDRIDLKIRENKVIAITFLLSNSVNHLEVQAHNFRGAVASFESIDFGRYVFINRADAEARLAELKGGKDVPKHNATR